MTIQLSHTFHNLRDSSRAGILPRVLGLRHGCRRVIDATAGFCRDSFLFASLGCEVLSLERDPEVYSLVKASLEKELADPALVDTLKRITLECVESIEVLKKRVHDFKPDIIYLDPMVHTKEKTARVKKEMKALQTHLSKDTTFERLFELSLQCSVSRVVVKRPLRALSLGRPNYSWKLRSTKYDLYLPKGPSQKK